MDGGDSRSKWSPGPGRDDQWVTRPKHEYDDERKKKNVDRAVTAQGFSTHTLTQIGIIFIPVIYNGTLTSNMVEIYRS